MSARFDLVKSSSSAVGHTETTGVWRFAHLHYCNRNCYSQRGTVSQSCTYSCC